MNELRRLLGLDPLAQEHAARTETYVTELHVALEKIGALMATNILTPVESAALAPDNLALMLQDDVGIRAMIGALEKLGPSRADKSTSCLRHVYATIDSPAWEQRSTAVAC